MTITDLDVKEEGREIGSFPEIPAAEIVEDIS